MTTGKRAKRPSKTNDVQNVSNSEFGMELKQHVLQNYFRYFSLGEKERDLTQSYDKAPTLTEMSKGQSDNTNSATKKFDYTAVADRLRTASWSSYGHPTGVVNLVYGPILHCCHPASRNVSEEWLQ